MPTPRASLLLEKHQLLLREDDWERDQPLDASPKGPFYPSRNTNQFYMGRPFGSASGSKSTVSAPAPAPSAAPAPAPSAPPPSSSTNTGAIGAHVGELRRSLDYK